MCLDVAMSSKSANVNVRQMERNPNPTPVQGPTMDLDANDGLRIARVAGGNMVNYAPLFSPDGNLLFVIYDCSIQAFSVTTGDLVRSYEHSSTSDGYFIGMVLDRTNSKYIYGCTAKGIIVSWKIDSGLLSDRFPVLKNAFATDSFHVLYDQDGVSTFLLLGKSHKKMFIQYNPRKKEVVEVVFPAIHRTNVKNTYNVRELSIEKRFDALHDPNTTPIIAAPGGDGLNYFAYIAKDRWYCVRIKPKPYVDSMPQYRSATPTVVTCHPTEAIVAVGDSLGCVVLYRNFLSNEKTMGETYHWHANPVKSLVFSYNASHFYSGGHERVLVKWSIGQEEKADLIPRLTDSIIHIAVGPENLKLVLSTADNGIQIMNALHKQTAIVQSFSKISADVPGDELFPAGLQVNPRTQVIIMNGKVGCIQFFSTYTKSLLYTLDITQRNYNTTEDRHVIHNTVVTRVAVNAHWLATVENWNDHHNSMETRLKFWKYDESRQTYSLTTNLENVHQGGVCDIAFSSRSRERDLQCATAGQERRIKLWSLDELETTDGREKLVWTCAGSVQHRNLPVRSLAFSQDASLLAAGFGNVLCTWNAETLQLKCALSAPSGYDGCVNRALLVLPAIGTKTQKPRAALAKQLNVYDEARSKIITEMVALMNGKVKSSCFENVTETLINRKLSSRILSASRKELVQGVSDAHKAIVVQKVQMNGKMNMSQRAELFGSLQIGCRAGEEMARLLEQRLLRSSQSARMVQQSLPKMADNMSRTIRFRGMRKMHNFNRRQMPLAHSANVFSHKGVQKQKKERTFEKRNDVRDDRNVRSNVVKSFSQIQNVLFCYGQFSHLVVVSTENRLVVWNLLSLKIQVSAALTIDRIALDPLTNLIATFTKDNELYVFLPNIPMPLYHRIGMPDVFGAVWVPRRYPSSQSFNVDWQATSQLYFLNAKQELLHLISDNDEELLGPVVDSDDEEPLGVDEGIHESPMGLKTQFAAMLAKQSTGSHVQRTTGLRPGITLGLAGKSAVRDIVSSSSHTMAPINLLCKEFLQSLLVAEESRTKENDPQTNQRMPSSAAVTTTKSADERETDVGVTEEVLIQENGGRLSKSKKARKAGVVNLAKQTKSNLGVPVVDIQSRKVHAEPIDIVF